MNEISYAATEIVVRSQQKGVFQSKLRATAPEFVGGNMNKKSANEARCLVCYDNISDSTPNLCPEEEHGAQICNTCIHPYIKSKLDLGFLGYCPNIRCPAPHKDAKNRTYSYKKWTAAIHPDETTRYDKFASSLLLFLCSGCHSLKSVLVAPAFDQNTELIKSEIQSITSCTENYTKFEESLAKYDEGSLNVSEFYVIISEIIPQFLTAKDEEIWTIIKNILLLIVDPEKRASLQLRHYRSRPRMRTNCCNKEHCWACKTKDFHESKSCEENTSSLDHSIVPCPQCGVSLAKGDGCNSVTCVCGTQFSWSTHKEYCENSAKFIAKFSDDPNWACANILTETIEFDDEDRSLAASWKATHVISVNHSLMHWWEKEYSPFPSQACVTLPAKAKSIVKNFQQAAGKVLARDLWIESHLNEVGKLKAAHKLAVSSIFASMYRELDRPLAALTLTGKLDGEKPSDILRCDKLLIESAQLWLIENKSIALKAKQDYKTSAVHQFLHLFGNKSPRQTTPQTPIFSLATEFCEEISNRDLIMSEDRSSASRPGGASCFPAAFARLPAEHSQITFEINDCSQSVNYLSIGLARNRMRISSSDGFGYSMDSWGVRDDRGETVEEAAVAECGSVLKRCRKFRQGDLITLSVDLVQGILIYDLNNGEFEHKFTIPAGESIEEFYFGVTFANDHVVSITSDHIPRFDNRCYSSNEHLGKAAASDFGNLNHSHSKALTCLLQRLRQLFRREGKIDKNSIRRESSRWELACGSIKECNIKFTPVKEFFNAWIKNKMEIAAALNSIPSSSRWTWSYLYDAVCWYRLNHRFYEEQSKSKLAMDFVAEFKTSAPSIAATALARPSSHSSSSSPNHYIDYIPAAKAYIACHEAEMQAWYDYNDTLIDPIVPRSTKGCLCIPRHHIAGLCRKEETRKAKTEKKKNRLLRRKASELLAATASNTA